MRVAFIKRCSFQFAKDLIKMLNTIAMTNDHKRENGSEISLPLHALTFCRFKGSLPSLLGFPPLPIPWPHELPSSFVENTKGISFLRRCSAPFVWPLWIMLRRELRFTKTSLLSSSLTASLGAYKKIMNDQLDLKLHNLHFSW